MQDITSKEEQQSRRQFSKLFCGEVSRLCTKDLAMNEDSWNEVILDDIVHRAYPGNKLTTEKIKVLITMLGWPADALYFTRPTERAVIDWIFPIVAEYISMATYIQFKQAEVPNPTQSVITFYNKFCKHNSHKAIRITTSDLYDLYLTWCFNTDRDAMTPKTFHTAFVRLGVSRNKGYCDGKSGVTYYLVKLSPEEVLEDEQSEIPKEETQRPIKDAPEQIRDDDRPGTEISPKLVDIPATNVSVEQERQDPLPVDGGDDSRDKGDDNEVKPAEHDEEPVASSVITLTGSEDPIQAPKNFAPTEPCETGAVKVADIPIPRSKPIQYPNDTTNVIGRLKQLPVGFRPTFDEIRICCKIAMDPFTLEQFVDMSSNAGFQFGPEQSQELYSFLLEYASVDLRELKKGAILNVTKLGDE